MRKLVFTIIVNEFFVMITFLAAFTLAIYDKRDKYDNLIERNRLGWIIIGSNMAISIFIAVMSTIDNIILITYLLNLAFKKIS